MVEINQCSGVTTAVTVTSTVGCGTSLFPYSTSTSPLGSTFTGPTITTSQQKFTPTSTTSSCTDMTTWTSSSSSCTDITTSISSTIPASTSACSYSYVGCYAELAKGHSLTKSRVAGKHTASTCSEACDGSMFCGLEQSGDCMSSLTFHLLPFVTSDLHFLHGLLTNSFLKATVAIIYHVVVASQSIPNALLPAQAHLANRVFFSLCTSSKSLSPMEF